MFHALYDLPVVTARIFMVYGPGQRNLRTLVPYTILSLLRGEAPELSSGTRLVDWIYGALPDRPFERIRRADLSTIRERLGWTPAVSLDEGLLSTIEFYRAMCPSLDGPRAD